MLTNKALRAASGAVFHGAEVTPTTDLDSSAGGHPCHHTARMYGSATVPAGRTKADGRTLHPSAAGCGRWPIVHECYSVHERRRYALVVRKHDGARTLMHMLDANTTVRDLLSSHPQAFDVLVAHGMCADCKADPPPVALQHFAEKHCDGKICDLLAELQAVI